MTGNNHPNRSRKINQMKFRTSAGSCRCCGSQSQNHHRAGCDWAQWAAACERAAKEGRRRPGLARFRREYVAKVGGGAAE